MITAQDRLTFRNKVKERFNSSFPWLGKPALEAGIKVGKPNQTTELAAEATADQPAAQVGKSQKKARLTFEAWYEKNRRQPAYSLLLGRCEDNLPLTLDLTNPTAGALLITGERGSGKSRLLRMMLSSVAENNAPEQTCFYILANNHHEYSDLGEAEACKQCLGLADPGAAQLFETLFKEIDQRREYPSLSYIVVGIDGLAQIAQIRDSDFQARFLRLVKHGPRLGVWLAATLTAQEAELLDPALVEAFRTHLLGSIANPSLATYLARDAEAPAGKLEGGTQFCAYVDEDWFKFWVSEPKGGAG
jgi:hypothetical protein